MTIRKFKDILKFQGTIILKAVNTHKKIDRKTGEEIIYYSVDSDSGLRFFSFSHRLTAGLVLGMEYEVEGSIQPGRFTMYLSLTGIYGERCKDEEMEEIEVEGEMLPF
jgi:hypothetical protein